MVPTSDFLRKIHYDSNSKCHASIFREWETNRAYDVTTQINDFINNAEGMAISQMEDTYFSINSFRGMNRRVENLWHLNAFVIDYDFYKIEPYSHLTPEEMYELIEPTLEFKPSFVVDSGRGLYLIYTFKHCSRVLIDLYRHIYRELIASQLRFGADAKASLPTQIIRIPGTYNSKSNTRVEIIDSNDTAYELTDFARILPYSYEEVKTYRASLKEKQKTHHEQYGNSTKSKKAYRVARIDKYFTDVYADLKTLVKMRNKVGVTEGYREYILFLTQYMALYFNHSLTEARNYAYKLNRMLTHPLTIDQVNRQCKPSKILPNIISIDTIIEKLEIMSDEQDSLQTLINSRRRYERQKRRKRGKSLITRGRTEKELEIFIRRDKVIRLKRQGMRNVAIAEEMKMSKQLVHSDLKYIHQNAHEFILTIQEILHEIKGYVKESAIARTLSKTLYNRLVEWLETFDTQPEYG